MVEAEKFFFITPNRIVTFTVLGYYVSMIYIFVTVHGGQNLAYNWVILQILVIAQKFKALF